MLIYLCKEFLRTESSSGEQLIWDIARYTEAILYAQKGKTLET